MESYSDGVTESAILSFGLISRWFSSDGTIGAAYGRLNKGLHHAVDGLTQRHTVATANEHATFTAGAAFRFDSSLTAAVDILQFASDNNVTKHVTLTLNTNGTITARRGTSAGTILGTSSALTLSATEFNYIEAKVKLHDTTGTVDIQVTNLSGVTSSVLSLSAQDTKNAGTKTVLDTVTWGTYNATTQALCDIYLTNGAGSVNAGFLGNTSVEPLFPNGNGSSSQLVGSDGNSIDNYLLVNEVLLGLSTYTGSGTAGDKDLYVMSDLPAGFDTIYGVMATACADRSASAAPNKIRPVVRSSGTNSTGTDHATTTSLAGAYFDVFELDPATSAVWASQAAVNAAEIGAEVRT